MDGKTIKDRLEALRKKMQRMGFDYYLIPTADFHGSEYVSGYFKVREYFSGFTGSAGELLVGREEALLWTDGRYFVQAALELKGTGITLMKQRVEGVPSIEEYLALHMTGGQTLAFDGRVVPNLQIEKIKKALKGKDIHFAYKEDPADNIWTNRPAFPGGEVYVLDDEFTGMTTSKKLEKVRESLREQEVDSLFLTKLDDIMWLCNIRGCDVECNPVAMSYFYMTQNEAILFLQRKVITKKVTEILKLHGVTIKLYEDCFGYLETLSDKKVLLDKGVCSFAVCETLAEHCTICFLKNPIPLMKAVKNSTELSHMRELYLKDSIAVTKFIYYLKKVAQVEQLTEVDAAKYLDGLRRQIPGFLDLSFPTISAYGANAAMMHYEAIPDNCAKLKKRGFLLVDSGGQYLGATTDVTRTISLGELTEEEREHYTLTAVGMLQLTHAKFLHGCTGRNLDILARHPLWEKGLDYRCGTGHGVGYILNVHEGPQALRWAYNKDAEEAVFEEGMDVTNEPGVYEEGKHGIRIENVMVVQKGEKNEYGQFMEFETLTFVPLDRSALVPHMLNETQKAWVNDYQKKVYEKLSAYLTEAEKQWLLEETAEL